MSCDWCKKKIGKDDPDGKFVKGTNNFKKDYHNGNKAHKRAEDIFIIKQNYFSIFETKKIHFFDTIFAHLIHSKHTQNAGFCM
jgi:hypothetical protein